MDNSNSKAITAVAADRDEPTVEEITAAGIDPEVWDDPECWDDKERAFYWQWKERKNAAADGARRLELAERLQLPATWSFLLPFINRLCGRVYPLDETARQTFYNWREKALFAGVQLINCDVAAELNTLAEADVNDILVSRNGDKVYRIVHKENRNDKSYVFLMAV